MSTTSPPVGIDDPRHAEDPPQDVLLRVTGLVKSFPLHAGLLRRRQVGEVSAVADVSLDVRRGETVGLVGESGSGKSTTARCLLRLVEPDAGTLTLRTRTQPDGRRGETDGPERVVDLMAASPGELRHLRREVQMVFQDPYASLNPRMTVAEAVGEPLSEHGVGTRAERRDRVAELIGLVGLGPEHADRYPQGFSGGQRQRIGIARALALDPRFLVLDEPVSSLDVSVQGQILNLFADLQERLGLTYLLIAHDLSVVRHASDRVAVMYLGKIVELAGREEIFDEPLHPYTVALLSAVPDPDDATRGGRGRIVLSGDLPSAASPPPGCRFSTRCPVAQDVCTQLEPPLRELGPGHRVACHFPGALAVDGSRRRPVLDGP